MSIASAYGMRSVLGSGRDPLYLFLLATLGASDLFGCSGRSVSPEHGDDSGGSAGVAGMGGTGPTASEGVLDCASPTPYLGEATGLESCHDGAFVHRATAGKCEPTPVLEVRYPTVPAGTPNCRGDADCQGTTNGRCYWQDGFGATCIPTCVDDSDCAEDQLCLCDSDVNHCVAATCRTDADCGDGLLCTNMKQACRSDLGVFVCQTRSDDCTTSCPNGTCTLTDLVPGSDRVCMPGTGGSCGRPFLVEGRPRVAALGPAGDWLAKGLSGPSVTGLGPSIRAELTRYWTDAALMEHASIAAFARFTLELLALGAPARLVEDATQAMADEQRHARMCFTVASAYAGKPLGPGPLDLAHSLGFTDLEHVTVTTFLEGCIGETIAAVEARELASRAADPAIAETLRIIAEDEARHSALAWRFVRWALARGGSALTRQLVAELGGELAEAAAKCDETASPNADVASSHGLLSESARRRLRVEVLREIVAPCLRTLTQNAPAEARMS